jgi:DNA-binding GntR family transcriptional regulator
MPARARTVPDSKPRVKAEHGTSVASAYQKIRELIVHGKLAPGTWVVENDLCEP